MNCLRELCCQWKTHWKVLSKQVRTILVITGHHHHLHCNFLLLLLPLLSSSLSPSPLRKTLTSSTDEDSEVLDSQREGAQHATKHLSLLPAGSSHLRPLCPLIPFPLIFESNYPDKKCQPASLNPTTSHYTAYEWWSFAITVTGQGKRQVAHWQTGVVHFYGKSTGLVPWYHSVGKVSLLRPWTTYADLI